MPRNRRSAIARPITRRRFVQATAMGMPLLGGLARAATGGLEAFAGATSVKAGGVLQLYARNPAAAWLVGSRQPFTVTRLGQPDRQVFSGTVVVYNRPVPADASANGCRSWGVAYNLAIPAQWRSGLYWVTLGTGAAQCTVPFVVRPAVRTPAAKVLVHIPVTTAQAYNPYGGKSLYEYNSSGGVRGTRVSFNRPFADPLNHSFDPWQPAFLRWLEKNGIVADFCSSLDLHQEPGLLSGYRLFTTAGHDEYWSREMRNHLDAFVAAGGNAAIFSGNTCWWQVRFDDQGGTGRRMVCFKSRTQDTGGTPRTKTTNWSDLATPDPENTTIGLSFVKGASWTNSLPRPASPFVVQQADHWLFAGTGLAAGAAFGAEQVGYETDAADFRLAADGRVHPTGLDGTPATLRILAQADCSDWDARAKALGLSGERPGHAAIGVFSRGGKAGTVLNIGTTDWVYGLQPELDGQTPNAIGRITLNVFNRLGGRWRETADVRHWQGRTAAGGFNSYCTLGTEVPAGMALAGTLCRALPSAEAGTVPVYRFRSATADAQGHRFALGLAASMPGWTRQGVACHAYAAPQAGTATVPVYQHRSTDAGGLPLLRYSTQAAAPAGWVLDGIAFYAPAA